MSAKSERAWLWGAVALGAIGLWYGNRKPALQPLQAAFNSELKKLDAQTGDLELLLNSKDEQRTAPAGGTVFIVHLYQVENGEPGDPAAYIVYATRTKNSLGTGIEPYETLGQAERSFSEISRQLRPSDADTVQAIFDRELEKLDARPGIETLLNWKEEQLTPPAGGTAFIVHLYQVENAPPGHPAAYLVYATRTANTSSANTEPFNTIHQGEQRFAELLNQLKPDPEVGP